MKNYKYMVYFSTGEYEIVYAGSEEQAKILAQAKQIEKGNSYNVSRIERFK